ncbi:hypothetical protein ABW21_db0200044 [Orbilia brochopaga]|nr:hypothetical protein ABW21_db0200044 [Drechslerella brochopaga]
MSPAPYGQGAAISDLRSYLKTQHPAQSLDECAKINYVPSLKGYQIRSELVKTTLADKVQLPAGFPSVVDGSLTWTASELTEGDWLVRLSEEDVQSVEAAIKSYLSKYGSVNHVSTETFPVSEAIKAKMQQTVSNLFDRRGFAVIRGLDSTKYTALERAVIFLGLSSYIGSKLGMQTLSKTGISHLTNLKPLYPEGLIKSPGYTNVHMSFHNDTAHIIALFVAGTAENGGGSMIASSAKVYNELAATKPHVIKTLAEDWKLNRFSTHDFESEEFYKRPLLYYQDGKLILFVARRPFTGSSPGDAPRPISLLQAEALDSVHFAAERHAIREFEDASMGAGADRRHMIRAFLKNEDRAYSLPPQLDGAFSEIYPEDVSTKDLNFRIDPFNSSALSQGPPAANPSGTNG